MITHYRAYPANSEGHFTGAYDIEAADDNAALVAAKALVRRDPIELWCAGRYVATLQANHTPA